MTHHRFLRAAIALTASLFGPFAAAQTTSTERDAAGDVLRQIEGLQARLKTADAGRRLSERPDAARDQVLARTEQLWSGAMQGLSDCIGHHPEVGWQEFRAVDTLDEGAAPPRVHRRHRTWRA